MRSILYARLQSNFVRSLIKGSTESPSGYSCTWWYARRQWWSKVNCRYATVTRCVCSVGIAAFCFADKIYKFTTCECIICYYRRGKDTVFNLLLDLTVVGIFKLIREWSKFQLHLYPNLLFYWPCITVYQYIETNVMHFLFSLLRIKGLYMFRALLVHPQEALHKRHLYIVCVLCQLAAPGLECNWCLRAILEQPTDITRKQYTKCHLCNSSWGWASNARNM
jgi:hypothetical protein